MKGFYTVGAVRTNRVIYPCNIKKKINEFALFMEQSDPDIHLVTVGSRQYYAYRYEGRLNGIDDAVVLITYPIMKILEKSKNQRFLIFQNFHFDAFGNENALRAVISTDTSLTTDEIISIYSERWAIEVFFRQAKNVLALDRYQIRSSDGIKRFWLIMSLVHLICCTGTGKYMNLLRGIRFFSESFTKNVLLLFINAALTIFL